MTKITSLHNPVIKQIIKLRKASERQRQELIIIEGFAEIKLAIAAGFSLDVLCYGEDWASKEHLPSRIMNREQLVVSREVVGELLFGTRYNGTMKKLLLLFLLLMFSGCHFYFEDVIVEEVDVYVTPDEEETE